MDQLGRYSFSTTSPILIRLPHEPGSVWPPPEAAERELELTIAEAFVP